MQSAGPSAGRRPEIEGIMRRSGCASPRGRRVRPSSEEGKIEFAVPSPAAPSATHRDAGGGIKRRDNLQLISDNKRPLQPGALPPFYITPRER
uniref:Uncharacterized protein n=1 Tax=Plectus sambesii TaxID=2011161 RepID=A0A914WI84_9BILA